MQQNLILLDRRALLDPSLAETLLISVGTVDQLIALANAAGQQGVVYEYELENNRLRIGPQLAVMLPQ